MLLKVRPEEFRYWHRYVERTKRRAMVMGIQTFNRLTGYSVFGKKQWYYNEKRPWTTDALIENFFKTKKKPLVEPVQKQTIFKGDIVEVLVGKDKGKKGVVKKVVTERNWCFVDGLHLKFTVEDKSATYPGIVVVREKPLFTTTEVALVDPSDNKAAEIEWRYLEDGTEVRVSKRTGRIIAMAPDARNMWDDFTDVSKYRASKTKDTTPEALQEVTFKPKLCTFEEEILEKHGIKEERKYQKKYWY